jgi:hypothetical protein
MVRQATALVAIAALLGSAAPAVSADDAVPAPVDHHWDGHQSLYEPRLAFLGELNRWDKYWSGLFPAGQEAPTPGLQQLGGELQAFKRTASSGMTAADLKTAKAAFKKWETRFNDELCSLPALAQSGTNCRTEAAQMRAAADSASRRVQQREEQRIAALASALGSTPAPTMFDNSGARAAAPAPAPPAPAAARAPAPRPAVAATAAPRAARPAPTYVPIPAAPAADADPSTIDKLVRAIKRAAPWEWDGNCLHYVWNAISKTLQTNVRAILGWAAHSANTFLAAVRRAPDLLARLDLHAVNPFDGDGTLKLQKGMTIFYDKNVCGFDPDDGHAEIVTSVSAGGTAGMATSSNVEHVRTACLAKAINNGLAMIVMPGR